MIWINIERANDWFNTKQDYEWVLEIAEMFNAQSIKGIKRGSDEKVIFRKSVGYF
jgi:hypothetical protein